jgi:hypothetical protein
MPACFTVYAVSYSKFQNVPKHIVCQGDEAAVHSHISATNAGDEPIEAEVANYFKLRGGKIAYISVVISRQGAKSWERRQS